MPEMAPGTRGRGSASRWRLPGLPGLQAVRWRQPEASSRSWEGVPAAGRKAGGVGVGDCCPRKVLEREASSPGGPRRRGAGEGVGGDAEGDQHLCQRPTTPGEGHLELAARHLVLGRWAGSSVRQWPEGGVCRGGAFCPRDGRLR